MARQARHGASDWARRIPFGLVVSKARHGRLGGVGHGALGPTCRSMAARGRRGSQWSGPARLGIRGTAGLAGCRQGKHGEARQAWLIPEDKASCGVTRQARHRIASEG
jgi:hypothetical protein